MNTIVDKEKINHLLTKYGGQINSAYLYWNNDFSGNTEVLFAKGEQVKECDGSVVGVRASNCMTPIMCITLRNMQELKLNVGLTQEDFDVSLDTETE